MLRDPEVVSYLNILQKQYVMCPIDKAANNIAFICKKYYVQVLIKELGLLSATSNTYQEVNDTLHNILQQQNNTLDSVFGLKIMARSLVVFHVFIGSQKCIKFHLVQDL